MTKLARAIPLLLVAFSVSAAAKSEITVPLVDEKGNLRCALGYEIETIEAKTLQNGKPATAAYTFCRDTLESRVRWIGRLESVRDSMLEDPKIGDWEKEQIRIAFNAHIRQQRIR